MSNNCSYKRQILTSHCDGMRRTKGEVDISKRGADYERTVGKVVSHTKKAITQLIGAVKSYRLLQYTVMNTEGVELPRSDSPNQTASAVRTPSSSAFGILQN